MEIHYILEDILLVYIYTYKNKPNYFFLAFNTKKNVNEHSLDLILIAN